MKWKNPTKFVIGCNIFAAICFGIVTYGKFYRENDDGLDVFIGNGTATGISGSELQTVSRMSDFGGVVCIQ